MLLGIGYLHRDAKDMPNAPVIKAGGFFALLAAFLAWYNALAGIADDSNRYVTLTALTLSSPLTQSLTPLQLLHHPSSPLPLVRKSHDGERQARSGGQQNGMRGDISLFERGGALGSVGSRKGSSNLHDIPHLIRGPSDQTVLEREASASIFHIGSLTYVHRILIAVVDSVRMYSCSKQADCR